jgi:hypothetical protein
MLLGQSDVLVHVERYDILEPINFMVDGLSLAIPR